MTGAICRIGEGIKKLLQLPDVNGSISSPLWGARVAGMTLEARLAERSCSASELQRLHKEKARNDSQQAKLQHKLQQEMG